MDCPDSHSFRYKKLLRIEKGQSESTWPLMFIPKLAESSLVRLFGFLGKQSSVASDTNEDLCTDQQEVVIHIVRT